MLGLVSAMDGERAMETSGEGQGAARERYFLERWRGDAQLTRIAAVVALVLHPIGGLTDIAIIGWDPRLWVLLPARIAASLLHVPIVRACAKERPPPFIERLIAIVFVVSVVAGVLLPTALRPTSVASQGGPLLLLLVLYALVFPAWRVRKVTVFLGVSAAYLVIGLYWRIYSDYGGTHELITISIFLVAIGTLIPRVSRRIERTEFERFLAQDELTRTIEQLEHEVSLREEREHALEQARARAEQANRAKTSFMASVSHELRTPLVGILGVTEMMREPEAALGPAARQRVEMLRGSGNYLLALVNDLLDYFKLEAGKLEMRSVPVELGAVVSAAIELSKPRADEQGIELRSQIDDSLPVWIMGDPTRLQQIMLNLLGNAVKFTERGHVALRIARDPERFGEWLRLEVEDTGRGMDESFVARMFEPFEQSVGTNEGTGLGLTITRRFVERMNGHLEVESALGQGTTIRVSLPVREAQAPRRPTEAAAGEDVPARSLGVLVGEDDRINGMVIAAMLRQQGHEATIVGDGRALVERLSQGSFDIVLTDVNMPVMDGVEAVTKIRQLPAPQGATPILALTADAFEDRHAVLLDAGLDGVLVKPISSEALARALKRHAGLGRLPAA